MKHRNAIACFILLAISINVAWRAHAATTNVVVFLETMATNPVVPPAAWTGTGCNYPWTVAYSGSNPFQQNGNANHGGGNRRCD